MSGEPGDPAGEAVSLPATMADIFLALVGVVVIMLLALVPAIRTPGGLAPPPPFEVWRAGLTLDGGTPAVLLAEADGLRLIGPEERLVPLDAVLDDPDVARALEAASARGDGVLLVIRPEGQEAAFQFTALAGRLGLDGVHHLRLDHACGYVLDPALATDCRRSPPAGARQ